MVRYRDITPAEMTPAQRPNCSEISASWPLDRVKLARSSSKYVNSARELALPGHEITSQIANPLGIELMAAGGRPANEHPHAFD